MAYEFHTRMQFMNHSTLDKFSCVINYHHMFGCFDDMGSCLFTTCFTILMSDQFALSLLILTIFLYRVILLPFLPRSVIQCIHTNMVRSFYRSYSCMLVDQAKDYPVQASLAKPSLPYLSVRCFFMKSIEVDLY